MNPRWRIAARDYSNNSGLTNIEKRTGPMQTEFEQKGTKVRTSNFTAE